MKTYCVKCRKNTENINPKMFRTKNNRLIMEAKCPVCGIKKSRFVSMLEIGYHVRISKYKNILAKGYAPN